MFGCVLSGLRKIWADLAGVPNCRDIFLVEAIGPLILLWNFPRIFRNCLWVLFVDNESAEASLVSGTSALPAADHITGLTWELCAIRSLVPYFDRVESRANPLDAFSRGVKEGPWRGIVEAKFPVKELIMLAVECGSKVW